MEEIACWIFLEEAELIMAGLKEEQAHQTINSYIKSFQDEAEAVTEETLPLTCSKYLRKMLYPRRAAAT